MSLFRKDIRPVLAGMNDAILRWVSDQDTLACLRRIRVLTGQIPTLTDREKFVDHVHKVLSVGRPDLAKRLIGAMGPYDWTRGAYLIARVLWYLLKAGLLVGLVVVVIRGLGCL